MKKSMFCVPVFNPFRAVPYPSKNEINGIIDNIIDLLNSKDCSLVFHIGQMLFPLLEYLADHPGKKEVVRQLVERKKLLFGPFFVQLHSGHTSGEALIRNLLIGHQKGRLIGDVQKTGFLPMMRGRNSQVPQILAGFNIDAVVIDANVQAMEKLISEFIWEGPDGSKLLVGRVMFRTCEQLTMPVTELKKVIERFTNLSSENVIIYSFYDRTGLEKLPENLEKLSGAAEAEVKVESLSDTVWNIKDSLDIKEIAGYKGEICIENRDINSDNQYDYFLRHSIEVGVVIHRLSNLIQYIIEPWSVISNLMKMSSNPRPEESLWIRFFKNQAFTYLTESSANEFIQTLCDELSSLTDESEKHLKGIVDGIVANIGIENANPKDYFFTIINPLPYSRTEIAEVVLEMPSILNRDTIVARDIGGREIPFKIISKEEGALFKLDNQDKAKYHCLVELKNIPGMGWKTFQIELNGRPKSFPAIPISAERHALENDYLRIEINENGTLEIFAKETGEFFSEVGYFIDEVDLGQYQADDKTTAHVPITTKKLHPQIKLLYNTPKAAAYRIEYYWEIPKMFVWNHSRRSPRHERINIIEVVSLDRLSRQVDLKIEIHDHAYDHQIKICFPIDFIPENSYTDGFFSVETRNFQSRRGCEELSMRNFVGVSSEESGFAVLSDGINEYQLIQSGRHNTLALTLVRNFQISKAEKPVEEDRLRNEKAEMHLAFYPHLANWESGEILIEALLFNTPLIVRQLTNYAGFLPAKIQFLKVNPDILLFSALKTADDDRSVILRLFNPTRNLVDGEINTCLPIEAARYLTLEEHIIANLEPIDPNRLGIKIFPRKIVTVKIIFKKEIQIYDIV